MRLDILASGSGGNALVVSTPRARVLVDAGLPPRTLTRRLEATGLAGSDLTQVCITHDHDDHATHARELVAGGLPVVATRGTLRKLGLPELRVLRPGLEWRMAEDLWATAVALPHDAAEPAGLVFTSERAGSTGGRRVGVLTDCGRPDRRVAQAFRGCDVLVLETNHDPTMLAEGTYPRWLKRRIGGPLGHLSNQQAAELLAMIGPPWPAVIVLAHLSQSNNRPELALEAVRAAVGDGPALALAHQARPIDPIDVDALGARVRARPIPRQLDLFPGMDGPDTSTTAA